jgi:PAS domain S-box-containing protein
VKPWQEQLATQGFWEGEVIQQTKEGRQLLVHAFITALKGESGKVVGAVAFNRDISDERKAEEAQMQLAAIVESSDDAIVSKNLDGMIKSWNKGAEKIFGYRAEEAIGKHISLIIPEELQYEEEEIISKIKKGIHLQHYDTERITKSGRRVSVSLSISPVRNSSGVIIGASKIGRDITERKKTEVATRESEERLRAMFHQAGVGVCLVDTEWKIIEVNPRFCSIIGYSEQELKGRSCLDMTHPDDILLNQKNLHDLAATKRETATFEKRYIRKNHSSVWVRVTMAKIRTQEQTAQQYVAMVEDISEYKLAESGLRESESRFRILAENIQNMAWMANPDGWIFWCNQRWYEYLGRSFETIKGWGWENTVHPDHMKRVHDFLSTAWKSGEPWEITFPLRSKEGGYRLFLTSGFPVRNSTGDLLRWIGTCTDIEGIKTAVKEHKD